MFLPVSILFLFASVTSATLAFLFLFFLPFGWECKGRKLFRYSKKKILFFFFSFSLAFHFSPFLPNRVAKVEVIFITPNFILKYFELFFSPLYLFPRSKQSDPTLQPCPLPSEAGCKSRKIIQTCKHCNGLFLGFGAKALKHKKKKFTRSER